MISSLLSDKENLPEWQLLKKISLTREEPGQRQEKKLEEKDQW